MNKKIVLGSCFCIILITIAIILFFTTKSEYLNDKYRYSLGTTTDANKYEVSSIPGKNDWKVDLYENTADSTGFDSNLLYKTRLLLGLGSVENSIWTTVKQGIDDSIASNLSTNTSNYIDNKKNETITKIETTINSIVGDLAKKVLVENYPYRITYTNADWPHLGFNEEYDFFEERNILGDKSIQLNGRGPRSKRENYDSPSDAFIISSA